MTSLSSLIGQGDEGRYFRYEEVDQIVDKAASNVQANYEFHIIRLGEDIEDLKRVHSKITNSYIYEITLMKQKHGFELQAIEIKYKFKNNRNFIGGLSLGIGLSSAIFLGARFIQINPIQVSF